MYREIKRHIHCDAIVREVVKNRGKNEQIRGFLYEMCNLSCGEEKAENCHYSNVFSCKELQESVLHPGMWSVAWQSTQDNKE